MRTNTKFTKLLKTAKEMMAVLEQIDFSIDANTWAANYNKLPWERWEQALAEAEERT